MKVVGRIVRYTGVLLIFIFSFLSIFFSHVARDIDNPYLQDLWSYAAHFEDPFYDLRMKKTLDPQKKSEEQVLAAIDDQSLEKIGRWPWSRHTWVKLIGKFKNYGAKVLAFDVLFSEEELACNEESPDGVMAAAIKDFQSTPGNKIILAYSLTQEGAGPALPELPGELLNYVIDTKQTKDGGFTPHKIDRMTYPVAKLIEAEPGLGFLDAQEDFDGVFRHYQFATNVDSLNFPSLGLLAYQAYSGDNGVVEINGPSAVFRSKQGALELNNKGEAKVRFLGAGINFKSVSMMKIMDADANDPELKSVLKDKIVFIGSTALAAHDLRHTPVDATLPGVFFHMNMVHMLLKGHFYKDSSESAKITLYILCAGMLLLLILQLIDNAIIHLIGLGLVCFGAYAVDTYYLLPLGFQIKLFFCLFCFIASYSWNTFINFYMTTKEKQKIRGAFSRYVAPAIVNQMLANPDKFKVGGEKRNITCIFSDVRDFTSISEKLTPQQLSTALNQYMGEMTDILFDTFGTLDKYIGDALVGYWNAPLDVADHAYHGVRGALKMVEALPVINKKFEAQGFPHFKTGIGINTGDCSVGNMGSNKIFSYTALGDNMNLGARLEGLCKFYGAQLIISENTFNALNDQQKSEFVFRELDFVRVKGKEKPIRIYEVLPSFHSMNKDREALAQYNQAYQLYAKAKFQESRDLLAKLHDKYPDDKSTKRLQEACEEYLKNPPAANWDGVTVYKEK